MIRPLALALVPFVALASSAAASIVNVPAGDPNWFSWGNSGGGSSAIAASTIIDADGAVQINGDRTRWNIINNIVGTGYGLVSNVSAFSFNWAVSAQGGGVPTAQAPALRLHVYDAGIGSGRDMQFIWEDGEQSAPVFVGGAGSLNTAYSGNFFAGRVYPFTSGFGRGLFDGAGVLIPGTDSAQSFAALIGNLTPGAFVYSYGMGVGSSVGAFSGWGDQLRIAFTGGSDTTYNFQVPAPSAAALLSLGALIVGRRRR